MGGGWLTGLLGGKILKNLDDSLFEIYFEVSMTNEQLVDKIKELLNADSDLGFLLKLKKEELETLVSCIREKVDRMG